MNQTARFAKIPQETISDISELEKKIKQATDQDVICVVYEKH